MEHTDKDSACEDEHYCTNCNEYTNHRCYYSNHERDSSQDRFECLVCGWIYLGITGEYEPPIEHKPLSNEGGNK